VPRKLPLKPERAAKFHQVISQRQPTLTVILENVIDPHNIGAVMRSCDSVGIMELYVLYNDIPAKKSLILGKKTSAGTRKWLDVHLFKDTDACFEAVKKKYHKIYATHLGESATTPYQADLTEPVALLFGNEGDGLTPKALQYADANIVIPQVGMAQSLNISVACAVTLYEAYRQRLQKGMYDTPQLSPQQQQTMFDEYILRAQQKGRIRVPTADAHLPLFHLDD
jgi:tRNA (guanosine-2'-O-)-methyltransferase